VPPWVGKDKEETVRVKVFFNAKTSFRTEYLPGGWLGISLKK